MTRLPSARLFVVDRSHAPGAARVLLSHVPAFS